MGAREARHQKKLERMDRAWSAVALGKTQREIAAELGVSQMSVFRLLKEAEAELLANVQDTVLAQKVRQTTRLEGLYREAMAAWERSKQDVTRRTVKQAGVGAEARTETALVVEQSHGNPAYLAQAVAIMADLRKVWGLDAPTKLAHSLPSPSADGGLERLTVDELVAYRDLLAKIEGRA